MRNIIFIFSLTGICCLASSCGERKTAEEQTTSSSSAEELVFSKSSDDSLTTDEKVEKSSSDKIDTTGSSLISNSSAGVTELEDTIIVSGAASAISETQDVSEASEGNQKNDTVTIEEKEKLQGMKQEAFATVPPELSARIVLHELPSKAAVGIKAYPNSYIIKLNNKVKYRDKFYVTMELASSDKPEQVLDFYQKGRENWFYIENSAVHTFKKDKDKYFRETNTLQVLPFDKNMYREIDSLLSFDAQTLIRIYYELPQQ